MSDVQISPLAKRLAEENSIDWRKIRGTGPEGRVIERDILTYLARIMSGEADLPAEPDKSEPAGPANMPAAVPANVANFAAASAGLAKEGVDLTALISGMPTSTSLEAMPPLNFGSLEPAAPAPVPEPVVPVVPVPVVPSFEMPVAAATEPVFEIDLDDLSEDADELVFENPTILEMPASTPDPIAAFAQPIAPVVTEPAWSAPVAPEPAWSAPVVPEPAWSAPVVPSAPIIPEPVAPTEPVWSAPVNPEPAWTAPVVPEPAWTAPVVPEPAWSATVIPEAAQPLLPPQPAWSVPEPVVPVQPAWTMPEKQPEVAAWSVPEPVFVAPPVATPVIPEPAFIPPTPIIEPAVSLPNLESVTPTHLNVPPMIEVVSPPVPEVPVVAPIQEIPVVPPIQEIPVVPPIPEMPVVAPIAAALAAPNLEPAPSVAMYNPPNSGVVSDYFQLFVARRELNTKPLEEIRAQLSASINHREISNEVFLARAVGRAIHLLGIEQFSLARLEASGVQAYSVNGIQHSFLEALQGISRATPSSPNGLLVVDASQLGIDDLVLPSAAGVLALGRGGKLTLAGNLPPLQSAEFLQKLAELLENPVGLVV